MDYTGDADGIRLALLQQRIANLEQEHINWSITLELLEATQQQGTKEYTNTVKTLASMEGIHADLLALRDTTQATIDAVATTAEIAEIPVATPVDVVAPTDTTPPVV